MVAFYLLFPYKMCMALSKIFQVVFPTGMRKRWWLFRPIGWLTAASTILGPLWTKKKGTLIVRIDGLGDMAIFRPFLDFYPDALQTTPQNITILGCHSWKTLAPHLFKEYKVVTLDEHKFEKRFFYRLKWALWLRWQNFETALTDIYFRKTLTAESMIHYTGAKVRIVSRPHLDERNSREFDYYLSKSTKIIETGKDRCHEIERHKAFIETLGGKPLSKINLALPWRDTASINDKPYVALNFGSNEAGRNWMLQNYIALAKALSDQGYQVYFVGGPREKELEDKILSQCQNYPAISSLIAQTDLPGLMDILKNAAAVITNETGPGHFAILLGTPTVMIYGGGHAETFMPYPSKYNPATARFVNHFMDCYYCYWRCPYRKKDEDPFPCIEKVSLDQVITALKELGIRKA